MKNDVCTIAFDLSLLVARNLSILLIERLDDALVDKESRHYTSVGKQPRTLLSSPQ